MLPRLVRGWPFGGGHGRAAQEDEVDGGRAVTLAWWSGELRCPVVAPSLLLSLSWRCSCRDDKELRESGRHGTVRLRWVWTGYNSEWVRGADRMLQLKGAAGGKAGGGRLVLFCCRSLTVGEAV